MWVPVGGPAGYPAARNDADVGRPLSTGRRDHAGILGSHVESGGDAPLGQRRGLPRIVDVHMSVDQTWQQSAALGVDDLAGVSGIGVGGVGLTRDQAVDHPQGARLAQSGAIEDPGVGDGQGSHRVTRLRAGRCLSE